MKKFGHPNVSIQVDKFDLENEIEVKMESKIPKNFLTIWLSASQVKELSDFLLEELKRINK
jgi:hypothetical protein